jgi:hypothetical protein
MADFLIVPPKLILSAAKSHLSTFFSFGGECLLPQLLDWLKSLARDFGAARSSIYLLPVSADLKFLVF